MKLSHSFAHGALIDERNVREPIPLPVEAVKEAITYCESNPPELLEDYAREEELMQATGMNDVAYKYYGKPKLLSPQERVRVMRS